tara:strand:- start:617 stop:1321 length:705 start_codon:yes stop_codon:yes gene_type:complete
LRKIWVSINILFWTLILGVSSIISIKISRNKNDFKYYSIKWSEFLIKISGVKLEINGKENIADDKNYIFAPNHTSFIDFPVLFVSVGKYLVFVAKKELKRIPIFNSILDISGFVFVDRENTDEAVKSLDKLKADIKNIPRSIVIFPEGTRSESLELGNFKKGAAVLGINTGLPIVPVYINGAFNWWDANFRNNSNEIVVNFGEPILTKDIKYSERENLTRLIKDRIIGLKKNGK